MQSLSFNSPSLAGNPKLSACCMNHSGCSHRSGGHSSGSRHAFGTSPSFGSSSMFKRTEYKPPNITFEWNTGAGVSDPYFVSPNGDGGDESSGLDISG